MRLTATLGIFLLLSVTSLAQTINDYRTIFSGNWNSITTWQRFNGTTWVGAATPPNASSNDITIQLLHTVTIPNGQTVSADQVFVDGNLTIAAGGTLNLANGAGADLTIGNVLSTLTVQGTLNRGNLTTIVNAFSAANIIFGSGGSYIHSYTITMGDLPAATWDPQSTLNLTGYTNTTTLTADNSWDQTFGNVVFNSPGQRGLIDLAGNIKTIKGNLTVTSTGNNIVQFSNTESVTILIGDAVSPIGGDVSISGTSRVTFNSSGTVVLDIYGNLDVTSTHSLGSHFTYTGNTTVNLFGDFSMNAGANGKLRLGAAGTTGVTTWNIYQDFNLVNGRVDENGSATTQGNLRFLANGTQTFANTGTMGGYLNYYVSPSTTLDLGTSAVSGASPSAFVLDGGTVILGSLDPLGALGTSSGNIRTPSAFRVYNPGSTIIYQGSGGQFMGNGQPTDTDVTTIIDNPSGVELTANRTLYGTTVLQSGNLDINDFILSINGTIQNTGGNFAGSALSRLVIQGTGDGDFGDISFDPAFNSLSYLTINRTGTNVSATLTSPLVLIDNLNLTRGTLINNSSLSMTDNALVTRYETSEFQGNAPTAVSGTYHVTYRTLSPAGGPFAVLSPGAEIPTNSTDLGNLTLQPQQNGDEFILNQNITVNGIVTLTRGSFSPGAFNVTMNGDNWNDNGGTFVPGDGLIIFNDSTVVGGTGTPLFGHIQVNAGSKLIYSKSFIIQGNINFIAGSSFDMDNFTATFSGGDTQAISANGATFYNITISKSSGQGIVLNSPLMLAGLLQFTSPSANVNLQSNGNLHLVSSSDAAGSGTASIYRLLSGNQVSGEVTVERYMSGEGRIYRFISSPVATATVAQLQDDFLVQGNFDDPSPTQNICNVKANSTTSTLFWYDETVAGPIGNGYIPYPSPGNSAAGSPLVVGRGYAAYIRQCVLPTLIDYEGQVNQGTFSLPVTYTVTDPSGDGWNLVGNPYPSAIDWDLSGWTKTRISSMIAVTDNGSGMTRYYDAGVTEDIPNGQIALGQGFWVRATAANPVLTIRENVKVTNASEFFRERSSFIPSMVIALSDGNETDKAYIKTISEASGSLDEYDAPKILNTNFNLSILSEDNHPLAINALNDIPCGSGLNLKTEGLEAGNYTLNLDTRNFFDAYEFTLVDRFTNNKVNIKDGHYSFQVTDESGSSSQDRFYIEVKSISADLNISITAPKGACGEMNEVKLATSEPGITYSIWSEAGNQLSTEVPGSGEPINFQVSTSSLSDGVNTLYVKATAPCSALPLSSAFSIIKSSPIIVKVSQEFACKSGSTRLMASAEHGDATYQWFDKESGGELLFTGPAFETPVSAKSKTYYVVAMNNESGCYSTPSPATTEVINFTEPEITATGSTLSSNFADGNQWYFEGAAIHGATGQSLSVTEPGLYELMVQFHGCSLSASYNFESGPAGLQVYPNPTIDEFTLSGIDETILQVELATPLGQQLSIIYKKGQKFDGQVNLRSLQDGLYLLIVTKAEQKYSYRIFKRAK
jgi:hypothetical protein